MVSVVLVVSLAAFVFVLYESVTVEVVVVDEVVIFVVSVCVIGDTVVILVELNLFISVFGASVAIVD